MNNTKRNILSFSGMIVFGGLVFAGCNPAPAQESNIEMVIETPTPSPLATPEPTPEATVEITPEPTPEPTPKPSDIEPGTIGHIFIENTNVDYPIMLAEDNEYYLNKDPNGKRNNGRGSIFADFRNADADMRRNIVLYGHNRKDRTMFTTLHKFEDKSFFEQNKYIDVDWQGEKEQYEIVYAGVVDYRQHYHINTVFHSEDELVTFFNEGALVAANIREGYHAQAGDEMITLSTCVARSVKDSDYKRMIVVGRKIRGEGEEKPMIIAAAQESSESGTPLIAPPGDTLDE